MSDELDNLGNTPPGWPWSGLAVIVLLGLGGFLMFRGLAAGSSVDSDAWAQAFSEELAQAKQQDKDLLIYFTADWCGPCQHMKKNVFPKPTVKSRLEQDFMMVMVDMTNPDRTASLRADKLGVQGIPLFVAVDTESGRVSRQVGASDASAFSTWLKRAGGSS